MLRFPNPGSTIANFVAVYSAAFERLHGQTVDLDDIVAAIVDANLATSSGYMGSEAIERSTRADRSRDPLYNQLKMYAELFRALGWLHPTEQSALNYTFTLLGRQIVAAGPHYLPLLGETVLGISYPSHVLTVQGDHNIRPIAFLLQIMLACEGGLSRDEMIVGPLSVGSDQESGTVERMQTLIHELRHSPEAINNGLERVGAERRIQINTLKNYTRWPIATMRDCGWTEKVRLRFRTGGRSFEVHQLTDSGREISEWITNAADIRVGIVNELPFEEKTALSIHAHYSMLERAGFDLSSVISTLEEHHSALRSALHLLSVPDDQPILFSPFQSLSVSDTQRIFPEVATVQATSESVSSEGVVVGRGSRDHLFVAPAFVQQESEAEDEESLALEEELRTLRASHSSEEAASETFVLAHASDTQNEFYPLVSRFFRVLGFRSELSRAGVHYQRWDACTWIDDTAIPIEIKSPTEEAFLSTKAIRQALENKVILLSRGGLRTEAETTTLIVGYQVPNERGDMSMLIDDIHSAFGVHIGVIDLATLAILGMRAATTDMTIDAAQLSQLRGFLHA